MGRRFSEEHLLFLKRSITPCQGILHKHVPEIKTFKLLVKKEEKNLTLASAL